MARSSEPQRYRIEIELLLSACLLLPMAACTGAQQAVPSSAELDAIKAADQAYVTSWLSNDPDQVMSTLTEDAVIMPSGIPALEGTAAIRQFWWPPGSPTATVTQFTALQHEVGGYGDIGFVRGSFTLGFEYDGDTYLSGGDYLSVLRRRPGGSWLITHRMWNDHPPQTD